MSGTRPSYLRWGSDRACLRRRRLGAASREGLSLVIPNLGEVPIAIPIINVIGAFLLGYLYEAVTRLDKARPTGANLKLLLGTGFCGGFTTYSSLATDTAVLFRDGLPGIRGDLRAGHGDRRRLRHLGGHRDCDRRQQPRPGPAQG